MKLKHLASIAIVLLLVVPFVMAAQDEDNSDIWLLGLFEGRAGRLVGLDSDGVVLDTVIEPYLSIDDERAIFGESFAPTFERMVYMDKGFGGGNASLTVVDMDRQETMTLADPFPDRVTDFALGPFSPDGTQVVAAGFIDMKDRLDDGSEEAFLAIWDVSDEGWELVTQIPALAISPDDTFAGSVRFAFWDERGILLAETCLPCDTQQNLFDWYFWQPDLGKPTRADVPPSRPTDRDVLATGEAITMTFDDRHAFSTEGGPTMRRVGNVIAYFAESGLPYEEAQVIYQTEGLPLHNAIWVMDGAAILVQMSEGANAAVVYRDGSRDWVTLDSTDFLLLAGTPDGWLIYGYDTRTVYRYRYDGETLTSEIVAEDVGGGVYTVIETPLGRDAEPGFKVIDAQ